MLGPVLSTEMFIPYDDEQFKELLSYTTYPIFKPDMLIRNKMKTTYIVIDGVEYRVYYKYSPELKEKVYFFDQYALFQVKNESGEKDSFWVVVENSNLGAEEGANVSEPFRVLNDVHL